MRDELTVGVWCNHCKTSHVWRTAPPGGLSRKASGRWQKEIAEAHRVEQARTLALPDGGAVLGVRFKSFGDNITVELKHPARVCGPVADGGAPCRPVDVDDPNLIPDHRAVGRHLLHVAKGMPDRAGIIVAVRSTKSTMVTAGGDPRRGVQFLVQPADGDSFWTGTYAELDD